MAALLPKKSISLFEIRLDDDILVLRGAESEASGVLLKGSIVLCCKDNISAKALNLSLKAMVRLRYLNYDFPITNAIINTSKKVISIATHHKETIPEYQNSAWGSPVPKVLKDTYPVYSHDFGSFLPADKQTIPAGNHEFPFEHIIPGGAPETVEGYYTASVVWQLKAVLDRGLLAHNHTARKHLRVVRSLPPSSLEFSQTMAVENIWTNKIEYSISIPNKAVVFGTSIPLHLNLVPLLKGLKLGKIDVFLKEMHTYTPKGAHKTHSRHIMTSTFQNHSEFPQEDGEEEGWKIRERLQLPRSLIRCLQDCDVAQIKVRHKLKFVVQLINPDGHISELRASLPVTLFISPNLLITEQNEVRQTTQEEQQTFDDPTAIHAPPAYEEHQYDQLFNGIDVDDFMSPMQSGSNTPLALSRQTSNEDFGAEAEEGAPPRRPSTSAGVSVMSPVSEVPLARYAMSRSRMESTPGIGPDDLAARLRGVEIRPSTISPGNHESSDYFSGSSGAQSPYESDSETPAVDIAEMSRVPSYTTAIKSHAMRTLSSDAAPRYEPGPSGMSTSPPGSPPRRGFLGRRASSVSLSSRYSRRGSQ